MSAPNASFVKSLFRKAGPASEAVLGFLDAVDHCPDTWRDLDHGLRKEIQTFERRQIASAYARILGADESTVARRQEFLLRHAVTSILFPLTDMEDKLLVHLEERGLPAMFHHSIRQLSDRNNDPLEVLRVADCCRMAVFRIEDTMRDLVEGDEGPKILLEGYVDALGELRHAIAGHQIPFGWVGVALLWVCANYGLGALPDDPTATEHF